MRLGKKFKEGENPPRGTWTISYWKTGKCSILDDIDQAYEYTYELLDFEPPPKPIVLEVGKWYLVEQGVFKMLRRFNGDNKRTSCLCLEGKSLPYIYEWIEEWAKVEK